MGALGSHMLWLHVNFLGPETDFLYAGNNKIILVKPLTMAYVLYVFLAFKSGARLYCTYFLGLDSLNKKKH